MISDKILNLEDYYENGDDNIGQDFIMPCLRECKKYRRGAGFFKSSSLIAYAEALYHVVKENVEIEILCSPALDKDKHLLDKQSQNQTKEQKLDTINRLQEDIILKIFKYQKDPEKHIRERADILAFLIAKEQLKIKIAIRKTDGWPDEMPDEDDIDRFSELYHVKRGYFTFADNKIIAFSGSFNETRNGHQKSFEEAYVHKNWDEGKKNTVDLIIKKTDRDWEETNEHLHVRPLSNDLIKKIRALAPPENKLPRKKIHIPKEPKKENKKLSDENLWDHQKEAINNWENNNYKGLFAMATGSGKTITAISAINNIRLKAKGSLILVVVPYRSLAMQWIHGLEAAKFKTLGAYSDFKGWDKKLTDQFVNAELTMEAYKGPIIVTVEDTFKSKKFQHLLAKFEEIEDLDKLIIVDECHHFNKKKQLKFLPEYFNYRIGLSATPFNRFDKKKNELFLLEYFDKEVITYTLEQAIDDGFLTPYNYHIIPVYLNEEETGNLKVINKNIAIAVENNDEESINKLSGKKTRLLASIEDKMTQLEKLIKTSKRHYALAYCGAASDEDDDGEKRRIIEKVTRLFADYNWRPNRITAEEKKMETRLKIIEDLEQKFIDVIVSIKVLDEGIDIPCCQTAYILSSSKDDKQFIQRRGRVLRRHDPSGKKLADVYDFVILGGVDSTDTVKALVQEEFYRIHQFAKSALNKEEIYNQFKAELQVHVENEQRELEENGRR